MQAKERLIVALDVDTFDEASALIDALSPAVDIFKVGIAPFTGFGEKVLAKLAGNNKKTFLDLKVHDIPNTVKNAARVAAEKNIFMMNFHCLGGEEMLRAAVDGAHQASKIGKTPILLGVTVLTSMGEEELAEVGLTGSVKEKVEGFARMAKRAGLDGVVASAKEARAIKDFLGEDFVVVTPGIRPDWAAKGDQKRILTPRQALEEGADYIVVGRPIIQAEDPMEAARRIIEEME